MQILNKSFILSPMSLPAFDIRFFKRDPDFGCFRGRAPLEIFCLTSACEMWLRLLLLILLQVFRVTPRPRDSAEEDSTSKPLVPLPSKRAIELVGAKFLGKTFHFERYRLFRCIN